VEEGRSNELLKTLEEEGEKRGIPSRLLAFYRDLFAVQSGNDELVKVSDPGLTKETIDERLVNGQPLIGYSEFSADRTGLNSLFLQVIKVFSEYEDLFGELPKSLTQPKRKTLPKSLIKAWFSGTKIPSSMAADNLDEHLLLEAITHATLKPYLVSFSRLLSGQIDQDRWKRNYCPVCGGKPDLAYLEGKEGARWLVCSICDTEWLFKRLECPYCKNNSHTKLAYYTDDDGLYRLYVCEKCKKYIKTIDMRATQRKIIFPVERVITLAIDNQAADEGYEPGNSS
jgi:FdhE protein